jgi:hypothetical protein
MRISVFNDTVMRVSADRMVMRIFEYNNTREFHSASVHFSMYVVISTR